MPKILATADLHGNLPRIPECDVLLIAGDICPMYNHGVDSQRNWLDSTFREWLRHLPVKHAIVGIAGNHDFVFENRMTTDALELPWRYLQDEATTLYPDTEDEVTVWGLPWIPNLPGWAFHLKKEGLKLRYDAITKGVDVILSHGPPYGCGDLAMGGVHAGCRSATDMLNRVQPKILVCGHIHEGFGHYRHNHRERITSIYNVAYVDEVYRPRGEIIELDLATETVEV